MSYSTTCHVITGTVGGYWGYLLASNAETGTGFKKIASTIGIFSLPILIFYGAGTLADQFIPTVPILGTSAKAVLQLYSGTLGTVALVHALDNWGF